jgi:hypothetical protein
MPELYRLAAEVTVRLEQRFAADPIGLIRAKGAIATKTGFLVSLVSPSDHDDPDKVRLLRLAAAELDIAI